MQNLNNGCVVLTLGKHADHIHGLGKLSVDGKAAEHAKEEECSDTAAEKRVYNNGAYGSAFGNFCNENTGERSIRNPVQPVENCP